MLGTPDPQSIVLGKVLKGANFNMATLNYVDFRGNNLQNATFYQASLFKARFEDANLFQTRFLEANLNEANFRGANLFKTHFYGLKNLAYAIGLEELDFFDYKNPNTDFEIYKIYLDQNSYDVLQSKKHPLCLNSLDFKNEICLCTFIVNNQKKITIKKEPLIQDLSFNLYTKAMHVN